MAIDTAAKRASALATFTHPYLRLVVPDGSTDRAAAGGLYNGFAGAPDVTAPTVSSATINSAGTSITFACSETVSVGAGGNGGFTLSMSGGAVTATYSSGSGSSSLVYSLSRTVQSGETGTHSYTQPGNGIEDAAGNDLASYSGATVTNNSTADTVVPTLTSATITAATTLRLIFSEAVTFGAGGNGGWTVSLSGGAATVSYASGSGTNTLLYTVNRSVAENETGTAAYTQPGNGVEDTTGNDLATIASTTIINGLSSGATVGQGRVRCNRRYPMRY